MMAEPPVFITVPHGRKKKVKKAMVLNSLAPTLPIVVPGFTAYLIDEPSRSAPNSPERGERKNKGFFKKHLQSRPKSPHHIKTSHSDPEHSAPPSPQTRPRWLPFKHKKKKSPDLNGDILATVSQTDLVSSSGSSTYEPEATPVEELPGRTMKSGSSVPEIRVSIEDHGEGHNESCVPGGLVSYEEINGCLDPYRKNSQSSRCSSGSGLMSVGTSGIGSYLSPSGDDESYAGSDLESPLSPCSRTSSFTEADLDPIDKDYPSRKKSSTFGSNDNLSVTTPTPTSESPPNALDSSVATLVSPSSSTEGKELKEGYKRKRDKNVWHRVRNAVKAWSPFAVQFKKKYYPWVQLAGHEDNFRPGGENGTIMKKSCVKERDALQGLMEDTLRSFVPEFKQEVEQEGEAYVEMTDLLREFNEPAVMDIKMGIRTYLEEELGKKDALRKDMYEKMIKVDPNEPTSEEYAQGAITKPRYMQWRESLSSTSNLGFRIEGIKTTTGKALKDFKKTRTSEDVTEALQTYITEHPSVKASFLKRLMDIRVALDSSSFFSTHELIGSSLLFVYDSSGLSSINMIDFGKTTPLPEGLSITHLDQWVEGNHEDGYLFGLDNLIRLWKEL